MYRVLPLAWKAWWECKMSRAQVLCICVCAHVSAHKLVHTVVSAPANWFRWILKPSSRSSPFRLTNYPPACWLLLSDTWAAVDRPARRCQDPGQEQMFPVNYCPQFDTWHAHCNEFHLVRTWALLKMGWLCFACTRGNFPHPCTEKPFNSHCHTRNGFLHEKFKKNSNIWARQFTGLKRNFN